MGWRFRKYIKIAPGVKLNISKSGISTTIGGKGASVNIGKDGAYLNTSIPGTGLYNRHKISSGKKAFKTSSVHDNPKDPGEDGFFKIGNNWGCVIRWYGLFAIVYLIIELYKIIAGNFENTEANISVMIFVTVSIIFIFIKPIMYFFKSLFKKQEKTSEEGNNEVNSLTDGVNAGKKVSAEKPLQEFNPGKTHDNTANSLNTNDLTEQIVDFTSNTTNNPSSNHREKEKDKKLTVKCLPNIGFVDPLLEDAAYYLVDKRVCSSITLQRELVIGYNRASRLINQLEALKIVRQTNDNEFELLVQDIDSLDNLFVSLQDPNRPDNIFGITE